jgi:hypothetical protein
MEDHVEIENTVWDEPLSIALDDFREFVGPTIYERFRPIIVETWQQYNNDSLVRDVIAKKTTFEDYLRVLVEANTQITLRGDTPPGFELLAKATGRIFEMILPITDRYDFGQPVLSLQKQKLMILKWYPAVLLAVTFFGISMSIAVMGGPDGILPGALLSIPISVLVWWVARRKYLVVQADYLSNRSSAALRLLEEAEQLTKELQSKN